MMNGYNYNALNNTLTISASFAKKASKVGSLEYNIVVKLRHDFPDLTIEQEAKKASKRSITYAQMGDFISFHRNANELTKMFNNVLMLSRIQPMPYNFVKTWFENRFPYYSEQPTFDADGYVIDPVTLANMRDMVQEVVVANKTKPIIVAPADVEVC